MRYAMSDMFDELEDDPSPICSACGVSALPAETPGELPECENPICEAFGEPVR